MVPMPLLADQDSIAAAVQGCIAKAGSTGHTLILGECPRWRGHVQCHHSGYKQFDAAIVIGTNGGVVSSGLAASSGRGLFV